MEKRINPVTSSKNAPFIGRQTELNRLKALLQKNTASFIALKGRRRIGKSRLMDEFGKSFTHYYKFEGLAPEKNVTAKHQLDEFSRQLSRQFNIANARYLDWSDAFFALGERVQLGRILLFFDEISWMGSVDPTFLAKLKVFWDNQLGKNTQLVFAVCSSASSWIEKNVLSQTAFLGRLSLTLTLEELPLSDCSRFWQKQIQISAYEKFKILSVTGGIPKYLEEVNPKLSAEENVKQICFTEGALLVNEFQRIFSDLFLRESRFYEHIVSILAYGSKDQHQIQTEISEQQNQLHGRLSEYLWELEEAGFIRRDYTWDVKTGEDSKLSRYRLRDNYLRFYLRYIKKNLTKIKRGAFGFKSLSLLSEWNTIMGLQFENLVLNNRRSVHEILQIDPNDIINDNPYFQTKTKRTPGCQVDYMIQTKFGTLYLCEIKFMKNEIDHWILEEVERKISSLKAPTRYSYRPVLIHVNGVSQSVVESDFFSKIIDFGELLHS
jgi:AAA+ ATPase superfamily predicted ATPase